MSGPDAWDAVDAALGSLRALRTAREYADQACELARQACAAEAAELVVDSGGTRLRSDPDGLLGCTSAASGQGCRDETVPVTSAGRTLGSLRVVGGPLPEPGITAAVAFTLGSVLGLVTTLDRAREHRTVTGTLGITDPAESPVELVDPGVIVAAPDRTPPPPAAERLSVRQREVLDLMLAGSTNAEIADRLVISVPTVKSHVRAILRACGAVNRADAISRLFREGRHAHRSASTGSGGGARS